MLERNDCQQHDKNEKPKYEVNPIDIEREIKTSLRISRKRVVIGNHCGKAKELETQRLTGWKW